MAAPKAEPSRRHPAIEAVVKELKQELEDMKAEAGEKPTCVNEPNRDPLNPKLAWNRRQILEQESELEAILGTPLVHLPSDPDLHLEMATETMLVASHRVARTLQFYKNRLEEVEYKEKIFNNMVKKATNVSEVLDRLRQQQRSKEENKIILQRRYDKLLVLFRFLRNELHFIVETYNHDEIPHPDVKRLEDLMDSIVTQMLKKPGDPYVEIDDTVEEAHITLLLCCNLIVRHPTDMTRIRFLDPRD